MTIIQLPVVAVQQLLDRSPYLYLFFGARSYSLFLVAAQYFSTLLILIPMLLVFARTYSTGLTVAHVAPS